MKRHSTLMMALALATSVAALAAPAAGTEPRSSETGLTVAKTRRYVYALGTVTPPAPDQRVKVRLARDTGSGFVSVAVKRAALSDARDVDGDGDRESRFGARFARPATGACRLTVIYPGNARTTKSSDRHDFPCGIPTFDTGTATITSDGGTVTVRVQIAETDEQRSYGLMYRRWLAADKGMIFLFEQDTTGGFWMKNTIIPLSIAFIDSAGVIIDIQDMDPCTQDPCPSYAPAQPYRSALEVNQGGFERWGVSEGDVVQLNR
ncbi:MAG TPA: DUF192 domain-containing protein [Actinomycetota bacterium]|nr:DUF192 domain-containing protein [Actinomycetota bacterium]